MNLLSVGFSLGCLHLLMLLYPLSAPVVSNYMYNDSSTSILTSLLMKFYISKPFCLACPPGCLTADSEIIIASSCFSVNTGNPTIFLPANPITCHLFCLLHVRLPCPNLSDLPPLKLQTYLLLAYYLPHPSPSLLSLNISSSFCAAQIPCTSCSLQMKLPLTVWPDTCTMLPQCSTHSRNTTVFLPIGLNSTIPVLKLSAIWSFPAFALPLFST